MPPRARETRPALVLVAVPCTAPDAAARRALAARELLALAGMLAEQAEGPTPEPGAVATPAPASVVREVAPRRGWARRTRVSRE